MQPEQRDRGAGSRWLAEEPGLDAARRELVRLCRRARFRLKTVFALSVALSLLVTAGSVFKKRTYEPHFILRVVEADRDPNTAPRTKRRLREYVEQAVFSNARLSSIIKRHGLYPSLARNNPQAALETFREDIVVDVYRNYFIEERSREDPPRSARISIGYRSSSRNTAVAVARALGNLVVEHEARIRRQQAADAASEAALAVERAREALRVREQQLQTKARELMQKDSEQARVEFAGLTHAVEGMQQQVELAERRKAAFDVGSVIEQRGLGLSFEIVDQGAVSTRYEWTAPDMARTGVVAFLLMIPLMMLTVGAFDGRILEEDDLTRLGLKILGRINVRRLPGGDWT